MDRWLSRRRSRRERGALILRYHRVADIASDPHAVVVSPQHFAEHVSVLRSHYEPITLAELVGSLVEGRSLGRGVAVTFDDGYADNLTTATPLLEHHQVPATVYITAGNIDQRDEFWWDTLERVLLCPGTLPPVLELIIDGEMRVWPLGPVAEYGSAEFEQQRAWTWRAGTCPTVRHRVFRELFRHLQAIEEASRRPVVQQLLAWARTPAEARPTHRTLSTSQTRELARHPLIEIGAHTVTHPLLSALPPARKREEVEESKAILERLLGKPVTTFAYPYGVEGGASSVVSAAGFESAVTVEEGLVRSGHDPFSLPRLYVGDWDGDEFAGRLRQWVA